MSNYNITSSTQLIQNYVLGQAMDPAECFEALQTNGGQSLLFSIGSDNALYVTVETSAQTTSGWQMTNLSSAELGTSGGLCTSFAANLDAAGMIHLAMVVSLNGSDVLYLSLNNSNTNLDWINAPTWQACPYDGPKEKTIGAINISNVYLNANSQGPYILVFMNSVADSQSSLVSCYYITPANTGGRRWIDAGMPADYNPADFLACYGNQTGVFSSGLYLAGTLNGENQIVFFPYDPDSIAPPAVTLLQAPAGSAPEAIAPLVNADGGTSLFVVANGTLYYYSETCQAQPGAAPVALISNGYMGGNTNWFTGVTKLTATLVNDTVTLWWINAVDVGNNLTENYLYYTSCSFSAINTGASNGTSFTVPVPLLQGAVNASPYINAVNGDNTIFAVDGSELRIFNKSAITSLWAQRQVILPPPSGSGSQNFPSYTTHVLVTDSNNQPVSNSPVSITANTANSFYVNNLYTIIDTSSVTVSTDSNGILTIVENISGLTGTQLAITLADGTSVSINPMDTTMQAVNDKINNAPPLSNTTMITYQNPNSQQKPLISQNADPTTVSSLQNATSSLYTAYNGINGSSAALSAGMGARRVQVIVNKRTSTGLDSLWGDLTTDVGDITSWVTNAIDTVGAMVLSVENDVYTLAINIADSVINFVLQTVEDVASAVQWLVTQIVDAVEDIIDFLKYLFDLGDMKMVKAVMENLWNVFLNSNTTFLKNAQAGFDTAMDGVLAAISSAWGNNNVLPATPANQSAGPSSSNLSNPQSNYLNYHYQNNASGSVYTYTPATPASGLLGPLQTALSQNSAELSALWTQASSICSSVATTPLLTTLEEIIKLFAESIVELAKTIGDAIFDLLIAIGQELSAIMNSNVTIPVVSDILSDFGVPQFSILDLLGWLVAVPSTIVYKLANAGSSNSSPFSVAADYTTLTTTTTLPISAQLSNVESEQEKMEGTQLIGAFWDNLSPQTASDLYVLAKAGAAFCQSIYTCTSALGLLSVGEDTQELLFCYKVTDYVGFAGETCQYISTLGYDPYPLQNPTMILLDNYALIVSVYFKGITTYFSAIESYDPATELKISSTLEAIVALLKMPPAIMRCIEFGTVDDASGNDLEMAIFNQIDELSANAAKVMAAYIIDSGDQQEEIQIAQAATNALSAIMRFTEFFKYCSDIE